MRRRGGEAGMAVARVEEAGGVGEQREGRWPVGDGRTASGRRETRCGGRWRGAGLGEVVRWMGKQVRDGDEGEHGREREEERKEKGGKKRKGKRRGQGLKKKGKRA